MFRPAAISITLAASALALSACSPASTAEAESINSIFGLDFENTDYAAQELAIQESIADCMTELGFEYVPFVWDGYDEVEYTVDPAEELERIKREGFGMTTYYGNNQPVYDDSEVIYDDVQDPNWEIAEALSEGEREAYYAALNGDQSLWEFEPEVDPETGEQIWPDDFNQFGGGCQGEAYEAAYGGQDDTYEAVQPFWEELNARVEADPRIIALNDGWITCMDGKGFEFDSQDDLWNVFLQDLQKEAEDIVGTEYGNPFAGWSDSEIDSFYTDSTEEEINAFWADFEASQAEPDYDEAALKAVQDREIAVAVADYECNDGRYDKYDEIYKKIEAEYIAQNRDALEAAANAAPAS